MLVQRSSVSGNAQDMVISDLMKALEHSKLAESNAGMDTLVFNVSVLYWRVSRNMMQVRHQQHTVHTAHCVPDNLH